MVDTGAIKCYYKDTLNSLVSREDGSCCFNRDRWPNPQDSNSICPTHALGPAYLLLMVMT